MIPVLSQFPHQNKNLVASQLNDSLKFEILFDTLRYNTVEVHGDRPGSRQQITTVQVVTYVWNIKFTWCFYKTQLILMFTIQMY